MFTDLKFPDQVLEAFFPAETKEGQNVSVHPVAEQFARSVLGARNKETLVWHTPDVFSVRYGSSYVASATLGEWTLRFHQYEGDFREGDDK